MNEQQPAPLLEHLLNPVTECFSADVAEALVSLRADAKSQSRLDELAEKSTAGTLTEREKAEYLTYVTAMDIIGIMQSKARRILAKKRSI